MTWASKVSIDAPADVTARITSILDQIDPYYRLDRLRKPTVIRWRDCSPDTYNATSWDDQVWINSSRFTVDGGWEQTLAHEMAHVVDKQLMTDPDQARVMALVKGCLASEYGVCTQPFTPVWGLDLSVPYLQRCGELFAETVSRHVWYAVIKGAGPVADLPAYGAYTFDPAVLVPVLLDVLAGPTVTPLQEEDPAMLVSRWYYGEGADLLAAMSAARADSGAVVTGRAGAKALVDAGATITVIGGPACAGLGLTWAVKGQAVTQGQVTAVLGATYADGLRMVLS